MTLQRLKPLPWRRERSQQRFSTILSHSQLVHCRLVLSGHLCPSDSVLPTQNPQTHPPSALSNHQHIPPILKISVHSCSPAPIKSGLTLHLLLGALSLTLLPSCKKDTPSHTTQNTQTTDPTLAAAQLNLANNHLNNNSPLEALPYLQASASNNPLPETKRLFSETLGSTPLSVPYLELLHPYPVTSVVQSENIIYAAIAGPYPTIIRWDMTSDPSVSAILFPIEAKSISHLILSPNDAYLLTQRDSTNLLCNAETLKPIASIGTLPQDLDPFAIQAFSDNSVLFAHPTESSNNSLTWQIRDSATGEPLRSETIAAFPKPTHARFSDTTLLIALEDGHVISIPLIGDVEKSKSKLPKPSPPVLETLSFDENKIILHFPVPASERIPIDVLTGYRLDPETQTLIAITTDERLKILSNIVPDLPSSLQIFSSRFPLETRLAAAFPDAFPELSETAVAQANIVRESFATDDNKAILETISTLPPHGLPTATALFLACESRNHEHINAVLNQAQNVPPAIKHLALGSTEIPDFASLRSSQDWFGYEAPDFSSLFKSLEKQKTETLSDLNLTASPSEDEIQTLFNRLIDPETIQKIGTSGISEAASTAAIKLAVSNQHAASSLKFTAIAERTGAHPAQILRYRATAFTSLADFTNAHRLWIDLITNQPEQAHLSSDYTEAAYTAFETSNPEQAIEILETGIFRFPRDVRFAIRAGQIAILTNHFEQAAKYLNHTTTLGIPPDEIENTTALLAISYSQLGEQELALSYLAQLEAIDESWQDPNAIDKLPWPASMKETLRDLISSRPETLPELSPENDQIDTVPLLGELPLLEPPLPEK